MKAKADTAAHTMMSCCKEIAGFFPSLVVLFLVPTEVEASALSNPTSSGRGLALLVITGSSFEFELLDGLPVLGILLTPFKC